MTRISQPEMALLYGDLELREGSLITEKLQNSGISFEMKDGGKQIYVPASEVLKSRMMIAEAGLPAGGSVGYEIFDRSDVLGSTNFVQNVNLLRAIEGELARTIRTLHGVSAVRVHVVLPQRTLFSKDRQKPTAAVVLKMRNESVRLSSPQVQAIQHLVASSIPNLLPDSISILDDRGVLLASGGEKERGHGSFAFQETRIMYETRTVRMIESLLEQSIGVGKVRAEVSIDLDMDKVTEQAESFDPESQVARSIQSVSDTQRSNEGGGNNVPTSVQSNIPSMTAGSTGGSGSQSSEGHKSEETTNYEISKTIKTAVKEMGGIKRLSVAVLLDGTYEKDDQGKEIYKERDPKEIKLLTKLIKAIVGFQEKRGDIISVMNLPFAKTEILSDEEGFFKRLGFSPKDWVRIIEALVLGSVVLMVFFFVFKPYMGSLLKTSDPSLGKTGNVFEEMGIAGPKVATTALMPGFSGNLEMAPPLRYLNEQEGYQNETPPLSNPDRLKILEMVEELIKKEPENAALILRIWMKK
jgi:flagellar M-ring protein FliF